MMCCCYDMGDWWCGHFVIVLLLLLLIVSLWLVMRLFYDIIIIIINKKDTCKSLNNFYFILELCNLFNLLTIIYYHLKLLLSLPTIFPIIITIPIPTPIGVGPNQWELHHDVIRPYWLCENCHPDDGREDY